MELYSGTLRLGGSVLHEVPKTGLTAPEVILLRAIHGQDAFKTLEPAGSQKIDHDEERDRLESIYGFNPETKKSWTAELFGPSHQELPTRVKGVTEPMGVKPRRRPEVSTGARPAGLPDQLGLPGIPASDAPAGEAGSIL